MKIENKEMATFDLSECPTHTDAVLHLSAADDPRWAGIVTLAPSHRYTLPPRSRHDMYVLHGSVEAGGIVLDKDGFASLCDAASCEPAALNFETIERLLEPIENSWVGRSRLTCMSLQC